MNPFKTFSKTLEIFVKKESIKQLEYLWNEKHRYYHNVNHLIQILQDIEKNLNFKPLSLNEKNALLIGAFFHDCIYDPKSKDNEDKSILYFKYVYKPKFEDSKFEQNVIELIECTKHRKKPINTLCRIFWDADNAGFKKGYDYLLKTEKLIRKEYSFVSNKEYKENRIKFLETCKGFFGIFADKNIDKLIVWITKKY